MARYRKPGDGAFYHVVPGQSLAPLFDDFTDGQTRRIRLYQSGGKARTYRLNSEQLRFAIGTFLSAISRYKLVQTIPSRYRTSVILDTDDAVIWAIEDSPFAIEVTD